MEKNLDLKAQLKQEIKNNPGGKWLLLGLLMNSRIVTRSPLAEELFIMFPDIIQFQSRELSNLDFFRQLQEDDLVFIEDASADELWLLGQNTAAQIISISDQELSESLYEARLPIHEFRATTLDLRSKYEMFKSFFRRDWILGDLQVPALFLDRDGVINIDHGYISSTESLELCPGILEFLQGAIQADYRIFVVTNQSGVSRNKISRAQADKINYCLQKKLAAEGIPVVEIQSAFYHEVSENLEGCLRASKRKPRAGMFLQLIEKYRLDASRSLMIGDSARDLQAAALAGVGRLFLLASVKSEKENNVWTQWPLRSRALKSSEYKMIQKLSEIQFMK